jgi:hypothetical protein
MVGRTGGLKKSFVICSRPVSDLLLAGASNKQYHIVVGSL